MSDDITARRFTVFDPIFKQEIIVFLNCTEETYLKWQAKLGVSNIEGLNSNFAGFSTRLSGDNVPDLYIIWLNHFSWTLDDQESLVHEIVHIITRIWENNNIKFSPETQEFFAHSVGGLYSLIGAKIMRRQLTKKKKSILTSPTKAMLR